MKRTVVALFVSALMLSGCSQPGSEDATYDIVLAGGRVMDPESGLDAIRNVGVRDELIAAVTENALDGTRIIDASGLVVAPGFIDLHVHGQTDYSFTFMIRDGVTSGFELEVGTGSPPRRHPRSSSLPRPTPSPWDTTTSWSITWKKNMPF